MADGGGQVRAPWQAQEGPQADAIAATWCPELFYGGAAGGGKSDFLLADFLQDVPTYASAWTGIIFRRTYPELEELLARSREVYPATGARWNEQKRTWSWSNGAALKMRYLERDQDATRYLGHQYAWEGWDELTQWRSLYPYRYLRARLRSAHPVPTKRIRSAANPGGAGHLEVKSYFIEPAPAGWEPLFDPVTGWERMFVPARLNDNRILVSHDPLYRGRLAGLGGNLARAMLDGDWDIIDGAFFDNWSAGRNVVLPFEVPGDWLRFRSLDWGSAKPFSVGWWCVVGDDFRATTYGGEQVPLRRGCLVRYREWYGSSGQPNVGLKLPAERVAAGIKEREQPGETIAYSVADPNINSSDGGPSIRERMFNAGVQWRLADNARVARAGAMGGWDQMRARINGDLELGADGQVVRDGGTMLATFSTCRDFIRTVPVLQHDQDRPEDIDTDAEDHAADEARYACMSRPWARTAPPPPPETRTLSSMTLDELVKISERRSGRSLRL